MTDDQRARLQRILDRHDAAIEALHDTDGPLTEAAIALTEASDHMVRAIRAHSAATQATYAAYRETRALLNDES